MTMPSFKEMTRTEYRTLHYWVEKQLGKPQCCEICGTQEPRRYEWANLSGEYRKELTDWRRLCMPCHHREKHSGHCIHGHELTAENTYVSPTGTTSCRICRKRTHAFHNAKRRRGKKYD